MENSAQAYLRTRVMSAAPEELRLMLLDGAVKFTRQAIDGLTEKNFEMSFNGFSQGRAIVLELATGISETADPELAERVRSIFLFIYRELMDASFAKDAAKAGKALELLEYERETWVLAMQKAAAERGQAVPGRTAEAGKPAAGGHAGATAGLGTSRSFSAQA
jgi:flagellar protein FliS